MSNSLSTGDLVRVIDTTNIHPSNGEVQIGSVWSVAALPVTTSKKDTAVLLRPVFAFGCEFAWADINSLEAIRDA